LGGVLCLHFPQLLSSPELRAYYPMDLIRALIEGLIWAALLFALLSALLGPNKRLALTGMLLALAAAGLGGSAVPIDEPLTNGPAIGLDWFLLDLFLMALIYVPIERIWPYYPRAGHVPAAMDARRGLLSSRPHLPIQILSFLVLLPATKATEYLAVPALAHGDRSCCRSWCSSSSRWSVADVAEWTIHYLLHKVPFLWRFHSIHHSSKRSTGSPARARTSSTTRWCAGSSSCR
jgi:lathosterol oxidase